VKRESWSLSCRGRAYGWWRRVESRAVHSLFPAIRDGLYGISAFLRTRVERRFTNDGLRGRPFAHPPY